MPRSCFLIPFSNQRNQVSWEVADSRSGAGSVQDESGASYSARKLKKKEIENKKNHADGGRSKKNI